MASETDGVRVARLAGAYGAIAALGVLCVVGPVIGTSPLMPAPLFPLLRTGIEKMTWESVALMALVGFVAGVVTGLPRVGIAAASVGLLPLAAFAEMAADGTSHNLIPFELVMYGVMGLPVLGMAALGRVVRGRAGTRAP